MKVALVPYPQTWKIEGGHRIQQGESARALMDLGVDASVVELRDIGAQAYDILHFFGDPRPLFSSRPPVGHVVVSPVYFPRAFRLGPTHWGGGRINMAATDMRHRLRQLRYRSEYRRLAADFNAQLAALKAADLLVVNSTAELKLLERDAGQLPPTEVVYSGVRPEFFHGQRNRGRTLLGLSDSELVVLCVARIEPRKNQLGLCQAVRSTSGRLVLVGEILPGNERYLNACTKQLPNLIHVEHIDHLELPHLYAAADVHVLPSWYETTGLSSLEAMASGCPVVVGSNPCVEEYFGDCALVVDLGRISALRAAIDSAARGPRGCEIELARRYSWAATAQGLRAAYVRLLEGHIGNAP